MRVRIDVDYNKCDIICGTELSPSRYYITKGVDQGIFRAHPDLVKEIHKVVHYDLDALLFLPIRSGDVYFVSSQQDQLFQSHVYVEGHGGDLWGIGIRAPLDEKAFPLT